MPNSRMQGLAKDAKAEEWMGRVKEFIRYRLKLERQLQGLTVGDVDQLAGIDPESVRRIENVAKASPRLDTLLAQCYSLQLDPARLFERSVLVPALVRLKVSRSPDRLARVIEKIQGVEYAFTNGRGVTVFVRFPDVDALGAFILDFMRVCSSHVVKTKTNVVIKRYVSSVSSRSFGSGEKPAVMVLGLYEVGFEDQDKLAAGLRELAHIQEVMAVTGDEDLFILVGAEDAAQVNRTIEQIESLKGIKRVELWFRKSGQQ